jgi:group I intron endonuclease
MSKLPCGIYKITNLKNNMCYVGQAVDIGSRWKQHIKRGIGAENPTKNKLYPAMLADGVENFTFEIIEQCSKEKLNEREQYWQDYFKAKEFGYSIK